MRSDNQLKINSALSFSSGIIFYSNTKTEYGVIATIDSNQNIHAEFGKVEELLLKHYEDKAYIIKSTIVKIVLMISLFFTLYFLMNREFLSCLRMLLGDLCFIYSLLLFTENISWKSSKFHSAEHKSINAYNSLNRPPTLEEVRFYSRFCKNCSTNTITYFQLTCTILFACTWINPFNLYLLIILLVLVFVLFKLNLLCWGQVFTTLKPTEKELEVAIKGIELWEKYERMLEKNEEKTDN